MHWRRGALDVRPGQSERLLDGQVLVGQVAPEVRWIVGVDRDHQACVEQPLQVVRLD
jgi:hypothetical protein